MDSKERCKSHNVKRVLLAEDDDELRALLALALRSSGYTPVECSDGLQLVGFIMASLSQREIAPFDLIVSDMRMRGLTGMEVLNWLQTIGRAPPVILITGCGDPELQRTAEAQGVAAFLEKPFELSQFMERIREIVPLQ